MKLKIILCISFFSVSHMLSADQLRDLIRDLSQKKFTASHVEDVHRLLNQGANPFNYMPNINMTLFSYVENLAKEGVPYAQEIMGLFLAHEFKKLSSWQLDVVHEINPLAMVPIILGRTSDMALMLGQYLPSVQNLQNQSLLSLYLEVEHYRKKMNRPYISPYSYVINFTANLEYKADEAFLQFAYRALITRFTGKDPGYFTSFISSQLMETIRNKIYDDFTKEQQDKTVNDLVRTVQSFKEFYEKSTDNSEIQIILENAYRLLYTKVTGIDPGLFTTIIDPIIIEKAKIMT